MSIDPAGDRTVAPFGRGELDAKMLRATRRPSLHPRHDEVRAMLLDVPAARGERAQRAYRMGDHYTLCEDGRAIWVKPERSYAVNDWWHDDAGEVWAIDDGALDGVLHGLSQSRLGIDGFIADLEAIRHPAVDKGEDDVEPDEEPYY